MGYGGSMTTIQDALKGVRIFQKDPNPAEPPDEVVEGELLPVDDEDDFEDEDDDAIEDAEFDDVDDNGLDDEPISEDK
jgi:hypothetical protein